MSDWINRTNKDVAIRSLTPEMVAREMVGKWPQQNNELATNARLWGKLQNLRKALIEFQTEYQTQSPNMVHTEVTDKREAEKIVKIIDDFDAFYKKVGISDKGDRGRRFTANQFAVQNVVDKLHFDLQKGIGAFNYLSN